MRAEQLGDPDLEEARRLLRDDRVALAVVKNGQVLAVRHGTGLAPLYRTVKELGERLQGARVADRVVGRAAALLLLYAGVAAAFGELMSQSAHALLTEKGFPHAWGKLVPSISTPNGAPCPMEALVADTDEPVEAFRRLAPALEARGGKGLL